MDVDFTPGEDETNASSGRYGKTRGQLVSIETKILLIEPGKLIVCRSRHSDAHQSMVGH